MYVYFKLTFVLLTVKLYRTTATAVIIWKADKFFFSSLKCLLVIPLVCFFMTVLVYARYMLLYLMGKIIVAVEVSALFQGAVAKRIVETGRLVFSGFWGWAFRCVSRRPALALYFLYGRVIVCNRYVNVSSRDRKSIFCFRLDGFN